MCMLVEIDNKFIYCFTLSRFFIELSICILAYIDNHFMKYLRMDIIL